MKRLASVVKNRNWYVQIEDIPTRTKHTNHPRKLFTTITVLF